VSHPGDLQRYLNIKSIKLENFKRLVNRKSRVERRDNQKALLPLTDRKKN
jgi:hypothetical protein